MEIIKLKKAKNYRDLGGIPTEDGRTVKKHMLIRGTPVRKFKKKDIQILKEEYNLTSIFDLRTKREAEERPDDNVSGVDYYLRPILNEATVGISHERGVHTIGTLENMPTMEELYINMVTDKCQENLISVLKEILLMPVEKFSLVFHCTAGKDRTGLLAGLLLAFLGVEKKYIIHDYMLTNLITKSKANFVYIGLLIVRFKHSFAKKIKMYYIAKESFLESAFESLEKQYGSMQNFFNIKLGFSEQETEEIKNKFLE